MPRHLGGATLPFDEHASVPFDEFLRGFEWHGSPTAVGVVRVPATGGPRSFSTLTNEFWTAKQRAAHSLHEISYRACFKPQLPRFFVEQLTKPDDIVYDPFMGRGTTLVEAVLMGRRAYGCDVNPLSRVLCEPRLQPPTLVEIERALADVDFSDVDDLPDELLVFYHPETPRHLCALRKHLLGRDQAGSLTRAEAWVRMVAVNRLTGHSAGFFSVYTLPPNQAVSVRAQAKINGRLCQSPPLHDVRSIILAKSRSLLRDLTDVARSQLENVTRGSRIIIGASSDTPKVESGSVALAVTSPPFLDVVDYKTDNWLRSWLLASTSPPSP
jgi:hypothetical protein